MPRVKESVILSAAKNLSSYFAAKKEGFFVATLLRMTASGRRLSAGRRVVQRALACVGLFFAFATVAAAGTATGIVHNGTDGKAAAGVDVILIQLQGGMQPVANTKTDSNGAFKFDFPAIGQQPMLIRAVYHGVMFHQPLPPGRTTVDVTVYEPSADSKMVNVGSRVIVLQPNGSNLLVGEEYGLQNQSQPPKAYFSDKGDFEFQIPQGAQLGQVSSWGPSGMPVTQGTMDRGKGKYAIAYAFQPGDNGVRLSYQLPYPSNHADLRLTSDYSVGRVMLVAPPTVQVKSDGFTSAGAEQGFNIYTRDLVPAGLPFDVSVSGTAPPPQASQQQEQGNDQDPEVNSRATATVQALPNRMDSLRWIIIGGFAALFALGLLLLWRQPALASAAGGEDLPVPPPPAAGPRKRKTRSGGAPYRSAVAPAPANSVSPTHASIARAEVETPSPTSLASASAGTQLARSASAVSTADVSSVEGSDLDREVQNSLESLKDRLFRLELRRQAGTISEEDYARERARTEQTLRELVRG